MQITVTGTVAEIIAFADTLRAGETAKLSVKQETYITMVREGGPIPAIKARRAETQCGLKEAKDYIEGLPGYPAAYSAYKAKNPNGY